MPRKKQQPKFTAPPQPGWAVYLRTSSEESQKPELSRARQRFTIERNVLDHSDMPVYDEYIDVLTGRTPNRPGYQQLLDDARAGKFSHVIVERADRFGRNDTEALRAIDELDEFGVAVRFANAPDLDPMDPDERVLVTLSFTLARRESALLGIRVKGGLHAKRQSGGWCGQAPDGYVNVEERTSPESKRQMGRFTRTIEIDPERAQLWRDAWALLLEDKYTLEEIAEELHARGYQRRRGSPFVTVSKTGKRRPHISTLSNTFHNWAYAGWLVSKANNIPPKTLRGNWDPIISTEDFERGLEILERRMEKRTHKGKQEYLLSGMIYYKSGIGKPVRLTCSTSNSGRSGGGTAYYRIAAAGGVSYLCKVIDERVAVELNRIQIDPQLIPLIRASYTHELSAKMGVFRPSERTRLLNVLKETDEEEIRIARLLATGKISESAWDELWSEWQDRRLQVRRTLESLDQQQSYHIDNLETALGIIAIVGKLYNGLERKDQKELLRQMVERVVVNDDGNVTLKLRAPFAYLCELSDEVKLAQEQQKRGKTKGGGGDPAARSGKRSTTVQLCWRTWIRTKINRARICRSAVELSATMD